MENYLVVYDAGTKVEMTAEEVKKFLIQLKTTDVVEFKGEFLTKFFKVIVRKELTEGYLHDGTKVFKKFGEWKSCYSPEANLDPRYYPEVAQDKVFSEAEFEKIKHLPTAERLHLVAGEKQLRLSNEPSSVGEVLRG